MLGGKPQTLFPPSPEAPVFGFFDVLSPEDGGPDDFGAEEVLQASAITCK